MRLLASSVERLRQAFHEHQIRTLPALQEVLGTTAAMTVFRNLKSLGYLTSYSHRGRYYTLPELAAFNDRGLWTVTDVWFSREGTLVRTCEAWVNRAVDGYYAAELRDALHVEVKDTLRQLVRERRLTRQDVGGRYLYVAVAPARRRQQVARRRQPAQVPAVLPERAAGRNADEVKAAIVLFYSILNEHQRRLYAGLESLKLGHGGDRQLAEWLDLDPHTVAKGRRELLDAERGTANLQRIRRSGGGRKALEKKRPR